LVAQAVDRDGVDVGDSLAAMADLARGPSYRVLYTQRHPDKYATSRMAEVAVYRYDNNSVTVSTVDLETGEVAVLDLPAGFPAPLVPEEIAEANRLAVLDPRVRERLEALGFDPDAARANGILTVASDPGAQCARSRCLRLFYSTLDYPLPLLTVVVDLSAMGVVELHEVEMDE
jgi:hypothetical protein